jgi:hypothetical protein
MVPSVSVERVKWSRASTGAADGRWLLDDDEALAFPFNESIGEPSRWNTLRALRILRWYERRG